MKANELLDQLFLFCEQHDASDIHLAPGLSPYFRLKGTLAPAQNFAPVAADTLDGIANLLLGRMTGKKVENAAERLNGRGSLDGACTSKGNSRYRFNIFRCQKNIGGLDVSGVDSQLSLSISLRRLEDRFRSLAELGLPERLNDFTKLKDGLVIVSGPTGSGKSTTLATLIDEINATRTGHIITIEDPVEYIHRSKTALVNQRQVGIDTPSFYEALVDSLREDPDVVLVGEIREIETIRTAIIAAETGHLVFTTLHAGDCVGAVERLVSVFPSGEQEAVRRQLSLVLRGIVAQRLLPSEKTDSGKKRIPVAEILMNTSAVANLIATGKSAQIYSAMESGASLGMQTLEQDLARLYFAGEIGTHTAMALARHPETLRHRIRNFSGEK